MVLLSNLEYLEQAISAKWFNPQHAHPTAMTEDKNPGTSYDHLLWVLNKRKIIVNNVLLIPITAEKSVVKVSAKGKDAFETPIISIYVPRKFQEAATMLNDFSINEQDNLSLIPFSLSKNLPDQFYYYMTKHAKFSHYHRNMQITSAPLLEYENQLSTDPLGSSTASVSCTTLAQMLQSNPSIHWVYPHPTLNKIQILVIWADTYPTVCAWIDTILPLFLYNPQRQVAPKFNPAQSGSLFPANSFPKGKKKYADKFAIPTEPESTFDPCASAPHFRTRRNPKHNAWSNGPPTELIYDASAPMEFLPLVLPTPINLTQDTTGGYGTNEGSDTIGNSGYDPRSHGRGGYRHSGCGRRRGSTFSSSVASLTHTIANNPPQPDTTPMIVHNPPASLPPVCPPNHNVIIAAAVAASNAKVSAEIKQNQTKFLQLEDEISKLHQLISENAQKVASITSQATIEAHTGPDSPFVTKVNNARNQQQHVQTQIQISTMQASVNRLLDTVSHALTREPHSLPDVLTTPPRDCKVPCRSYDDEPPNAVESPADSTNTNQSHQVDEMAVDDGVGEDETSAPSHPTGQHFLPVSTVPRDSLNNPSQPPVHALPPPIAYPIGEGPEPSAKTSWQGHHFSPEIQDANTCISFTNIHGLCTKGTSLNEATNDLLASHQQYSIQNTICRWNHQNYPNNYIQPYSQGSEAPILRISSTQVKRFPAAIVLASWAAPGW
jgi:hypothetical protein